MQVSQIQIFQFKTFFQIILPSAFAQNVPNKKEGLCRTRNNIYLPQNEFNMDSCILCYRFMSNYSFKDNLPLDLPILEVRDDAQKERFA